MTTKDQSRMPAGIPYIVANEFAERFCYYGINAILSVYLVNFLHFGDAQEVDQIDRSEEHTSELQSLMRISYAVFCLKKKKNKLQTTVILYVYKTIYTPTHNEG